MKISQPLKASQIAVIAGVIVLVVAGIVVYFQAAKEEPAPAAQNETVVQPATQTAASDTADWQTYRNDNIGFEIKYPKDYKPTENGDNVTFAVDGPTINYGLTAQFLNGFTDLQAYINDRIAGSSISRTVPQKNIKVGGLSGIEVEGFGEAGAYRDIYIQSGDYTFWFSIPKEGNAANLKTFDQMLSTFKIIAPQAGAAKTEVITYQPHRDSATQYKTIGGDCWENSPMVNRVDAYRCNSENQISDPCFVLPNEKLLICGVDIATGKGGFLLQPTKEPPTGALWSNNIPGWAMQVQLASGEICSFTGGATLDIKGGRLNYLCGNKASTVSMSTVIYGDLTVGNVWKANVANLELDATTKEWRTISTKVVDIAKVWQ